MHRSASVQASIVSIMDDAFLRQQASIVLRGRCYTAGQQGGRAVAGNQPSIGAAADRAAAHQFARSLSHTTSLPASPETQAMPKSPFAAASKGAGSEASQQGVGAPPSLGVRTLSRHFSEKKTQQPQTVRSAAGPDLSCCCFGGIGGADSGLLQYKLHL